MSIQSRIRKKQQRTFETMRGLNNGFDRKIDDWELIDIHQISTKIKQGDEFDFWCWNQKDLYLLRLMKSEINVFSAAKSKGRDAVIYLVVKTDFIELNNEELKEILDKLKQFGIPNWTVDKINIELK